MTHHKIITLKDGRKFYFNLYLAQQVGIALDEVKFGNQDLVVVIDGGEGSGKTFDSWQFSAFCASYLGSEFDVDGVKNIHNDIDKYIQSSIDSGKFTIHILDEGRKILNRKRSMGFEAVRFTNYLSECRDKNQVHVILVPSFHDLDAYIVEHRMTMLIHIEKDMIRDKERQSGYRSVFGMAKVYFNTPTSKIRLYYDRFKFRYPKKADLSLKFDTFCVLSTKGLEAYQNQKDRLRKQKYYESKEWQKKIEQTPQDIS